MMKCPNCGSDMKEEDRACIKCGAVNPYNPLNKEFIDKYGTKKQKKLSKFNKPGKRHSKALIFIILLIIILIIAFLIYKFVL